MWQSSSKLAMFTIYQKCFNSSLLYINQFLNLAAKIHLLKMSPNLSAYVHVSLYTIEDLSFILSDNFAQGISNLKEEHRVVMIYL